MEAGGILTELNRAKVLFQQRALLAALDIPVSRSEFREGADSSDPTGDATPTTSPIISEYRPAFLYHPNADAGEKADHRQEQACCGVAGDTHANGQQVSTHTASEYRAAEPEFTQAMRNLFKEDA